MVLPLNYPKRMVLNMEVLRMFLCRRNRWMLVIRNMEANQAFFNQQLPDGSGVYFVYGNGVKHLYLPPAFDIAGLNCQSFGSLCSF